jgi:hypothetical protein
LRREGPSYANTWDGHSRRDSRKCKGFGDRNIPVGIKKKTRRPQSWSTESKRRVMGNVVGEVAQAHIRIEKL